MPQIQSVNGKGKELVFSSFEDLHKSMRDTACPHFIYRGAPKYSYDLRPRIARKIATPINPEDEERFYDEERKRFEIFKAKALSYASHTARSDWEWLTLAQHYGIATRLLDWTENPLVALYFCALHTTDSLGNPAYSDEDGVLYACHPTDAYPADAKSPFANDKHGLLVAPHLTQRLIAQAAVFTIHHKPWEEFVDPHHEIWKVRITKEFKKELVQVLPRYGFSRKTMYADFDSAATELDNYLEVTKCKKNKPFKMHLPQI